MHKTKRAAMIRRRNIGFGNEGSIIHPIVSVLGVEVVIDKAVDHWASEGDEDSDFSSPVRSHREVLTLWTIVVLS